MTRSPILKASLAAFLAGVLSTGAALAQEPAPSLPPPPPSPSGATPPPSGAPPPPPTAPPPALLAEPRSEVRFDANEPGLRVLALGGAVPVPGVVGYRYGWWAGPGIAPFYTPICRAPCSTQLVPGPYQLALAKGSGAVPVREPVLIQGPAWVHGTYVDRSGLRIAGWVIGIVGSVGGAVLIGVSSRNRETICNADGVCYERVHYDGGLLGGGIAVVVASVVVGSILLAQHDEAHVTVEPLTLPASGALREAPVVALGSAAPPQGASVALHF